MKKEVGRQLWLMAAVSLIPVLGTYFLLYVWHPAPRLSGVLLPAEAPPPETLHGHESQWQKLPGRWVLATVGEDSEPLTKRYIYLMRQFHVALGPDQKERIARLWVCQKRCGQETLADFPGTLFVASADLYSWFASHAQGLPGFFVLDRQGRLVLTFSQNTPEKAMLKDIEKLVAPSKGSL